MSFYPSFYNNNYIRVDTYIGTQYTYRAAITKPDRPKDCVRSLVYTYVTQNGLYPNRQVNINDRH